MKSFSILRTNTGLTTNIKITIDSDYNISLDSFNTNNILASNRYKNFKINKDVLYDEAISLFYKGTPTDISYDIKYDDDNRTMSDDFNFQFDNIYNYGASDITDNKNYKEDYQYLAPLYIEPNRMPSNFIIFRTDGINTNNINSDNFNNNVINKLKTIKVFDLKSNNIGEWLDNSFVSNSNFPQTPLEIDFRQLEFSKWNGIDYETGGYISKSSFLDDFFSEEKEIFEMEKEIFNSYKNNSVVFPNILNMNFLFDDKPANPDSERKWSINNYYGFYLDEIEHVSSISPYVSKKLRDDVIIKKGNLIHSDNNPNNPFIDDWDDEIPFYVEYLGEHFIVTRFTTDVNDDISQFQSDGFVDEGYQNLKNNSFKIISSENLEGKENLINKNNGTITEDNFITNDNDDFNILDFDNASVWLIKIDGIYHNIIKIGDRFKINTDYSFKINETSFEYKVNGVNRKINSKVSFDDKPISFKIYKLNFTDIKDFDTKIVDTDYSKYEYEYKNKLTNTDESKMYFTDKKSNSIPEDVDDFIFNNKVVNIPVSSEYTANFETFKINKNTLSDIWRINPIYCRWGYQNSLSGNDKPYLLNNSNIFEDFNRTSNVIGVKQNRLDRNLDYFYTFNSSNTDYSHHSLHIEDYFNNSAINTEFNFNEDEYLNSDYDYFTYLLERKQRFDNSNILRNVKKYSYFNIGDDIVPNNTLFRGISVDVNNVSDIFINNSRNIEFLNLSPNNEFENYKFSIILTDNDSDLSWNIIEKWEMDKEYDSEDITIFDDILYISNKSSKITNPTVNVNNISVKSAPYNNSDWDIYNNDSIFWNPIKNDYSDTGTPDIIFNSNRYYRYVNEGNIDFWNPKVQTTVDEYSFNDKVIFKGKFYISNENNNITRPDSHLKKWKEIPKEESKWKEIEIWNPSLSYNPDTLIVHEDVVYISNTENEIENGEEPGVSIFWDKLYTFNPNKDIGENSKIFKLNNRYYLLKGSENNGELSNGVKVYINKKWKNILINIYINDNTLLNIRNTDRDDLYKDIYNILTANNLINIINNITDKSGFIDDLEYIIVEEDGGINNYSFNNNINNIPYLLSCNFPDELETKNNSLLTNYKENPNIKINLKLNNGNISSINKLNWYNGNPFSYTIDKNENEIKQQKNLNGIVNNQTDTIYRHSGFYMPIFYDIELFKKDFKEKKVGNYIFDTTLTDFGFVKERIFRKINTNGSILKLAESDNDISIYPMIEEFGYTFSDFFIFKTTWDKEYYFETVENKNKNNILSNNIIYTNTEDVGQPIDLKIENEKKFRL